MRDTPSDVDVAYDTRSGRIVGVRLGSHDPVGDWAPESDPDLEYVGILRVPLPDGARGDLYAVDTGRKCLVAVSTRAQGVSFAFGRTGGTSMESSSAG